MGTDVEDAFYVFSEDGTYMKFARFKTTNSYMYVIEEESEVLTYSTVASESSKFSSIDQTQAKAVRELQQVLGSPSDYDLANAVKSNVVSSISVTRRDIRITTVTHGRDTAALKEK